jgi:hypothetical protein
VRNGMYKSGEKWIVVIWVEKGQRIELEQVEM